MYPVYRWAACLCLAVAAPALAGAVDLKGKPTLPNNTLPAEPADKPTCGSHGTAIDFVDTPREAAKLAKKQTKLVLVLHVSGHFEDPRFT
jgi:hypothetical protein